MSTTIPIARLPSAPQTPANEWANDTAMRLQTTAASDPNDIHPPPHVQAAPVQPLQSAMLPDVVSQPYQPTVDINQKPPLLSALHDRALDINAQSAASTPGNELPGGWGAHSTSATTAPGAEKTTTIYEDVSNVLNTVGQTAFGILPDSLKNSLSTAPSDPNAPTATETLSNVTQNVADTTSNAATTAVNTTGDAAATTSQTLSGASNTVANATSGLVAQAKETIANLSGVANSNIPSSGPLDLESHTTSGGGVGNLPGPANEPSVAVLPDERKAAIGDHYVATPTFGTGGAGGLGGVGDLPGPAHEGGVARLPEERKLDKAPGFTSTHAGVGDLPGGPGEVGVAKLPEERAVEKGVSEAQKPLVSLKGTGVGDLPGSKSETEVAKLPEERANPATSANDSRVPNHDQSTASAFLDPKVATPNPDQPSTQKPSILASTIDPHSPTPKKDIETSSASSRSSTAPPATPPKEPHHASPATSPTHSKFSEAVPKAAHHKDGSDAGSEKKVGFREKLRGEMKVLTGKLTKNESKVVHGQAIKAGEMQHN